MNVQAMTVLMENGPGDMDVKAFIMQKSNEWPPRILVTYHTLDADGEDVDAGFESPEEGHDMRPDAVEIEDGRTAVDNAIEFIKAEGGSEPSASFFHVGVWYSTADDEIDYHSGHRTQRSFHLKGFKPEEEAYVYKAVTGQQR